MSVPMKVQTTAEYAELSFRVPVAHAAAVQKIINDLLALLEQADEDDYPYTVNEVFPEGITPDSVLRGARYREGLTQAQLAARMGVKVSHISEME